MTTFGGLKPTGCPTPGVVTLTVEATIPVDRAAAFDALVPFDAHLAAATAVRSVERDGDGGVGTRYTVAVARFGRSETLESVVTEVRPPSTVCWEATRPVEGCWHLAADGRGTRVTVTATADDTLLDRLGIGRGLLSVGAEAVLTRAVRGELTAVLEHLVADAGGDPSAVRLTGLSLDRSADGPA